MDENGNIAISLIISIAAGVIFGLLTEIYEASQTENGFQEKNACDYVGATLGGAIAGAATSFGGAILLGGLGEFTETLFSGEMTLSSFFSSLLEGMLSGAIGYGVGKVVDYGVSFIELGVGKILSKLIGNNKVNHFFRSMGAENVKVGMKNIFSSVNKLANASDNYIASFFDSLVEGGISWLEKRFATRTA